MSLRELNYAQAAQWIQSRCTEKATTDQLIAAMHALAHAAARAEADCAIAELFPGFKLEVLFSRDLEASIQSDGLPPVPVKVELTALQAIGQAVSSEMLIQSKPLLTFSVSGCGEIVVFQPEARETVLLATRTTLLNP